MLMSVMKQCSDPNCFERVWINRETHLPNNNMWLSITLPVKFDQTTEMFWSRVLFFCPEHAEKLEISLVNSGVHTERNSGGLDYQGFGPLYSIIANSSPSKPKPARELFTVVPPEGC
jgi:hypothetical protein